MDGRDDFADWSSFREPRGGRDDRGGRDERRGADQYGFDFDLDGDARVPAPRSGDSRYASLAELSERGAERGAERGGAERGSAERGAERPRGRERDRERDRGQDREARGQDRFPIPVDPDFAPRGQRSGEPLPPLPGPVPGSAMPGSPMPGPPMGGQVYPEPEPLRQRTETVDAAAVRRSVAESDGVYRSKRPALAAAFGIFAGLGELMMLRPLLAGLFALEAGKALAPLLAMVAFPFLALGLYAVTTGAATAVQFQGPRVWLRTPLVYLVIGAALMMAAASAA
ncbi:hypothetical protein [Catellatospora sp. TT07R-123]|uniref:hypothetical protein n=1 Tax=Catellatospora sp. TT07R-123 TaxID=2733863 RepID=UPI001BB3C622|nr:hypothetical protein [Catellatospora sp. TT07R-123]